MRRGVLFAVFAVMALSGCKSLEMAIRQDRNDCVVWPRHELGIVCPEGKQWDEAMREFYERNLKDCKDAYYREAIKYPGGEVVALCRRANPYSNKPLEHRFAVKPEWGLMPEWKDLFEEGSTRTRVTWKAEGWDE